MTSLNTIRLNRNRYTHLGRALQNVPDCSADAEENTYLWGVRHCDAHTFEFDHYPFNEFIYLLKGTVEVATNDGLVSRFIQSDCFVIPRGLQCTWTSTDEVRKFYVLSEQQASLNRFQLERIINTSYLQLLAQPRPVKNIC